MYLDSLVMILTEQMERDKRGMHKICCSHFIIWTTASFSLVWRTWSVEVAGKIGTRCVDCALNAAILCNYNYIFFNSNYCSLICLDAYINIRNTLHVDYPTNTQVSEQNLFSATWMCLLLTSADDIWGFFCHLLNVLRKIFPPPTKR